MRFSHHRLATQTARVKAWFEHQFGTTLIGLAGAMLGSVALSFSMPDESDQVGSDSMDRQSHGIAVPSGSDSDPVTVPNPSPNP